MDNKPKDNDDIYLSVVVVSRNDGHTGDIIRRTQICVGGLVRQLEKHKIQSELLLVEWFPPEENPLLADVLEWPEKTDYCSVWSLPVHPGAAPNYEYTETYSIRDLTPWNVGIKRARGDFVLSTVTDAIISDEMMSHIADHGLEDKAFYRVDRTDVDRRVLELDDFERQLCYCSRNIVDVHGYNPLKSIFNRGLPPVHNKAPGDFMMMSRNTWHKISGFPQGLDLGADVLCLYTAYASGAKQIVLKKPMRFFHIDHDSTWKDPTYTSLRKKMLKLRMPPMLVDVLAAAGTRVLSRRSATKPAARKTSMEQVRAIIEDVVSGKVPYHYNGDDWGLGKADIPRRRIV